MLFAAYTRVSSEDQVGNFSIDAQVRAIREWVTSQGGELVETYIDEGEAGDMISRPAFRQLVRDAQQGGFDAVVVHKLDRFGRDYVDTLAVKALLRNDYTLKMLSSTELSADSEDETGLLEEILLEGFAAWYRENLSKEVTKSKRERAMQDYHNNQAPFGMMKGDDQILYPDPEQIDGLRLAFERYATGKFSDVSIAKLLDEKGYTSIKGRPISKEMVRDMLQNRTYLGYVRYKKTTYHPDGRRSKEGKIGLKGYMKL